MSKRASMPLVAAYNHRPDIFDGLTLPDDVFNKAYPDMYLDKPILDKETLIGSLLAEFGQMSLLHTDLDFLKFEIAAWSSKHQYVWTRMYETLFYKYNPIWNKDGVIRREETHTNSSEGSGTDTETVSDITNSSSELTSERTAGTDETGQTLHSVNGFDDTSGAASMKVHDKTDVTDNIDTTETRSSEGSGTDNRQITRNKRTGSSASGSGADTYEATEQGNIGVTMTQDMIEKQRQIIAFNFYDYVIISFKERFLLMLY